MIKIYYVDDVVTNLAEVLVEVWQSSGDDSSITVALSTARDGKCLSTASLSVGKDCPIVTCQHTETNNMEHLMGKKNAISSQSAQKCYVFHL